LAANRFDNELLRQANALRHARQPDFGALMHRSGSYVRIVNLEAHIFDPLSRLHPLIDAQGRRQSEWTTVDPALIRGLGTA